MMEIIRSAMVGKKIVSIDVEDNGYKITLNCGNIVYIIPILDRGVDTLQARVKVSIL